MKLNLQFFAEDANGAEKTEQPTAKKLDDARKEGLIPALRPGWILLYWIWDFFHCPLTLFVCIDKIEEIIRYCENGKLFKIERISEK